MIDTAIVERGIVEGVPFTCAGDLKILHDHELTLDINRGILIDSTVPVLSWLVDRFNDLFYDTQKYLEERRASPRKIPVDYLSKGFRLFNHKYGFTQVLFSECKLKEVAGV